MKPMYEQCGKGNPMAEIEGAATSIEEAQKVRTISRSTIFRYHVHRQREMREMAEEKMKEGGKK